MNTGLNNGVPENLLEQYAMGKLSNDSCAALEEHLLICATCQVRLQQLDEFIRATKAAITSLRHRPAIYSGPRDVAPAIATQSGICFRLSGFVC